jgi:hypothetical protein
MRGVALNSGVTRQSRKEWNESGICDAAAEIWLEPCSEELAQEMRL